MELHILSFAAILSFLLFIFKTLRIWKKCNSSTHPPGPWKLTLLGNIHQLVSAQPHHRLRDLAKTYGPVMRIQLGELSVVVISSPDAAKEVLKTQDITFADRPISLATKMLLYNGNDIVFGPYGDQWRQLRKISILELLSAKRVQSFKSVREEEISNFISFLHSKAGTPVNLTQLLLALTNSIMARISVGEKCKNPELLHVIDALFEASGGFSIADLFPSYNFLHVISGIKLKFQRLYRETDKILEDIINEHRTSRAVYKNGDHQVEADNLLDVLLDLQENGNLQVPLTNDNIKGTILDMFAAGSDTSSKTAEWAMSELIKNPKLLRKAQEEVRRVFSEKGNVDGAGILDLKFLKLVIKETLRLHPALPLVPRECRRSSRINQYEIDPKTKIFINVWALCRDSKSWTEAEKFDPERFIDVSIDYKGTNPEFIPFGAGKRICPGMMLGATHVELFLAQLLYHFDWKLPDGITPENFDMAESYGGSINRKIDLKLIPIPFHPLPGE